MRCIAEARHRLERQRRRQCGGWQRRGTAKHSGEKQGHVSVKQREGTAMKRIERQRLRRAGSSGGKAKSRIAKAKASTVARGAATETLGGIERNEGTAWFGIGNVGHGSVWVKLRMARWRKSEAKIGGVWQWLGQARSSNEKEELGEGLYRLAMAQRSTAKFSGAQQRKGLAAWRSVLEKQSAERA